MLRPSEQRNRLFPNCAVSGERGGCLVVCLVLVLNETELLEEMLARFVDVGVQGGLPFWIARVWPAP